MKTYNKVENKQNILSLGCKHYAMVHIPGISVQKNATGRITHVTIDVEQQKELAQPVLERLEVEENDTLTLEESLASTLAYVDHLFDTDEKRKN